jgi:alkanesulfonate monooxygenase SsuD/methylene tetrahydromethanopterin reductase-like flavin-dependent oxidoreductase (luciferase family)
MPRNFGLAQYRSLVTAVAQAGVDAALFVRSPGPGSPMLDAQPLIAALASLPVDIGLGASVPIDYTEPFHLARTMAAVDRLTNGRSAVVIDLAAGSDCAAQFGRGPRKTASHARAAEFLEVTTKLWDSWEDGALLVDRPAGLFTNADKIHRIDHDGPYFTVRGPLNAPRPIQGWPVIIMPVASPAASEVAAQIADVALISCTTPNAAQSACADIRGRAAAHGRRLQAVRILVDFVPILGRTEAEARRRADASGEGDPDTLRFVGTPKRCAALMRDWITIGACDGFNLLLPTSTADPAAGLNLLTTCIAACARPRAGDGATLRAHLRLPRPLSRYAA